MAAACASCRAYKDDTLTSKTGETGLELLPQQAAKEKTLLIEEYKLDIGKKRRDREELCMGWSKPKTKGKKGGC